MRTILSKQFTTEKKNSAEKGLKKKKKNEKKKKKKSAQSQHCILVVCTTQQGAGAGEGTIWSWKNTCPTARSQARQNACALRQPRHTFYREVVGSTGTSRTVQAEAIVTRVRVNQTKLDLPVLDFTPPDSFGRVCAPQTPMRQYCRFLAVAALTFVCADGGVVHMPLNRTAEAFASDGNLMRSRRTSCDKEDVWTCFYSPLALCTS